MRIPTLLALSILLLGLIVGVFYYRSIQTPSSNTIQPSDIQVVNLTDSQATIIWQTPKEDTGFVSWGQSSNLGSIAQDFRDKKDLSMHITHFVNLNNLKSDSEYFFKIRSGSYFYPPQPVKFKTAKKLDLTEATKTNRSVSGVVLSSNLTPVDEAIIILEVSDALPQAAITTAGGNFILPTIGLIRSDLSKSFTIQNDTPATLLVIRGDIKTEIKLSLPGQQPLPKIILGQNVDFSKLSLATASAQIASGSATTNPYDLNHDGQVNSVDMAILLLNFGKRKGDPGFNPQADFDHDGVIDIKDVELLKKAMH